MPKSRRDVYYIEVVGRALDVLEVFVQERKAQLTLKEIADSLNQSMNTVFRLLFTLCEHGYVVKNRKKYELGAKLFDLTNAKLRYTDLVPIAGPYMEALRERFRETVNLGVMMEGQVRYIEVRESLEAFRLAEKVGARDPLHCTALGKAHLAWLPFSEVRELTNRYGMTRLTPHTMTSLTALKADLERIRQQGYALDCEEAVLGAFCIAVPILDDQHRPVAAISIAGPRVRINEAHVGPISAALKEAVAAIQKQLRTGSGPLEETEAGSASIAASPARQGSRK